MTDAGLPSDQVLSSSPPSPPNSCPSPRAHQKARSSCLRRPSSPSSHSWCSSPSPCTGCPFHSSRSAAVCTRSRGRGRGTTPLAPSARAGAHISPSGRRRSGMCSLGRRSSSTATRTGMRRAALPPSRRRPRRRRSRRKTGTGSRTRARRAKSGARIPQTARRCWRSGKKARTTLLNGGGGQAMR